MTTDFCNAQMHDMLKKISEDVCDIKIQNATVNAHVGNLIKDMESQKLISKNQRTYLLKTREVAAKSYAELQDRLVREVRDTNDRLEERSKEIREEIAGTIEKISAVEGGIPRMLRYCGMACTGIGAVLVFLLDRLHLFFGRT